MEGKIYLQSGQKSTCTLATLSITTCSLQHSPTTLQMLSMGVKRTIRKIKYNYKHKQQRECLNQAAVHRLKNYFREFPQPPPSHAAYNILLGIHFSCSFSILGQNIRTLGREYMALYVLQQGITAGLQRLLVPLGRNAERSPTHPLNGPTVISESHPAK